MIWPVYITQPVGPVLYSGKGKEMVGTTTFGTQVVNPNMTFSNETRAFSECRPVPSSQSGPSLEN